MTAAGRVPFAPHVLKTLGIPLGHPLLLVALPEHKRHGKNGQLGRKYGRFTQRVSGERETEKQEKIFHGRLADAESREHLG